MGWRSSSSPMIPCSGAVGWNTLFIHLFRMARSRPLPSGLSRTNFEQFLEQVTETRRLIRRIADGETARSDPLPSPDMAQFDSLRQSQNDATALRTRYAILRRYFAQYARNFNSRRSTMKTTSLKPFDARLKEHGRWRGLSQASEPQAVGSQSVASGIIGFFSSKGRCSNTRSGNGPGRRRPLGASGDGYSFSATAVAQLRVASDHRCRNEEAEVYRASVACCSRGFVASS